MFMQNFVISFLEKMINNSYLEATSEKILLVQNFNKTCILQVIVINGNIFVLIMFKVIKIILLLSQR
jgi:hypothetical protein